MGGGATATLLRRLEDEVGLEEEREEVLARLGVLLTVEVRPEGATWRLDFLEESSQSVR